MHELAITQSVVDAVSKRTAGAPVHAVTLTIGRLSGVVPASVRFCFELVCAGTPLEDAELIIVEPPGVGQCRTCQGNFTMPDQFPLCPCGSADVAVVSGREMTITSVKME